MENEVGRCSIKELNGTMVFEHIKQCDEWMHRTRLFQMGITTNASTNLAEHYRGDRSMWNENQ